MKVPGVTRCCQPFTNICPHKHLKDTRFTQTEREAYESECDFIEIFDGSCKFSDQYVVTVTPGLDIGGLMREWCFDYSHNHGYTVPELFPGDSLSAGIPSGIDAPGRDFPNHQPLRREFPERGVGFGEALNGMS